MSLNNPTPDLQDGVLHADKTAGQTISIAPEARPGAVARLMSVDALRGFDMFWIIGADSLVYALHRMTANKTTSFLAYELDHSEWAGFRFYDLIFPLFVFIVGISLVFSHTKAVAQGSRSNAIARVFRRTICLYLLGIFYYGGFAHEWPDMRLVGVLDRIAVCYFFASLIFLYCKPRMIPWICAGILLGYWALMALTPVRDIQLTKPVLAQRAAETGNAQVAALLRDPDYNPSTVKNSPAMAFARQQYFATTNYVTGAFGPGHNLSDHTDFLYLPGKHWDNFYDPEGFLSTIPAIGTCLLGVLCGLLLRNRKMPDQQKVWILLGAGAVAVCLGWIWGIEFPVIKKIWTSSYVLVAGGWSAILMGTFFLIVDVWKWQRWCQPFVWIGMNSITIYLAENILGGFDKVSARFAGGSVESFLDAHVTAGFGSLVVTLLGLFLAFLFVRFLYRRKVFLRL